MIGRGSARAVVSLLGGSLVVACAPAGSSDGCPAWTRAVDDRCVLRAWQVPGVDDAVSEPGAREVQVALGTASDALIAWTIADTATGHVALAEGIDDGWSTMALRGAAGVGLEPAVAIGPSGEALVAWKQQGEQGAIHLATRDRQRRWQLPTAPISWAETAYEPRVAFAADEALLVWNQWTGTNFGVAVARRAAGDPAFAIPPDAGALLSAPVNYANAPRVAVAGDEALIAWYQAPIDDLMVFVSERRGSDADFERVAVDAFVSAPGGPVDSHVEANAWPAVHEDGAAAVVWTQQHGETWDIAVYAATRESDGTWHTPTSLEAARSVPGAFARCPQAAFTPDGALVITWYETREGDTAVFVLHEGAGAPLRLSANEVDAVHPTLVIDGDGGVLVAWAQADRSAPDTWRVIARRQQPGGAQWLDAEAISQPQAGLAPTPAVAIAPDDGAVRVAWAQGGVIDGRVYTASLR